MMTTQKNSLIERALREYPETRNSDKKLMLAVWHLQNPNYEDNFKEFMLHKAISPETITRKRRKLQEEGKYPASEQVDNFRYTRFQQTRLNGGELVWEHEA